MHLRDIQRAVRAQRIERAPGDAPSLGHLARMPGTGLPKGSRRRKKRSTRSRGNRDRRHRQRVIMVWSSVIATVTMGCICMAVWFWLRPLLNRMNKAGGMEGDGLKGQERIMSRFDSPPQDVAVDLVKRALQVRDPGSVADYFRLRANSPESVVDFLRTLEQVDGKITNYNWRSSMDANHLLLDGVLVESKLGDTKRYRLAILTPDASGKWQIDFEAFARTVVPSWSELLAMTTGQGMVRVMIAKDTYYNGPFHDDSRWTCYALGSPDHADYLLGYCRKSTPHAAALEGILARQNPEPGGNMPIRAVLELRRSEGAEPRQFEITRVLAEDWVMADKAFDENYQ